MHILHLYSCSLIFIFGATKSFVQSLSRVLQKASQKAICDEVVLSLLCFPLLGGRGLPLQADSSLPGRLTVWFGEWLSLTRPFLQHPQNKRAQPLVEMPHHAVCGDKLKYQKRWLHPPLRPCVTAAWPRAYKEISVQGLVLITGFLQPIKMQRYHYIIPLKAGPISSRWFSNSENNSEQEMACSPYLLVDIVIPAEVSCPPRKDVDMDMLEIREQVTVITKIMPFFSGLSAFFSTHTSNHALTWKAGGNVFCHKYLRNMGKRNKNKTKVIMKCHFDVILLLFFSVKRLWQSLHVI